MKKILLLSILGSSFLIIGCSSIKLEGNAQQVMVVNSDQKIPAGCKYLGQASGSQGNFFTGTYTTNENLAIGAMNDMKNKAAALGGNYVQLLTNQASVTGSGGLVGGGLQQSGVVNMGNVYNCPESSLFTN